MRDAALLIACGMKDASHAILAIGHELHLWGVVDERLSNSEELSVDPRYTNASDADTQAASLVARMAQGDGDALVSLYDMYGRLAFGLAYRVLNDAAVSEEVVQDAFERAWKSAVSFDTSRGNVRSWVMTIVRNRAIDVVRSRQHRRETPLDTSPVDRQYSEPDVAAAVLQSLTGEEVRGAVRQLPEEQRHAIELAYFGGFTQHEIAERTGAPLGTVKSRMRLGLKHLHTMLSQDLRTDGDGF